LIGLTPKQADHADHRCTDPSLDHRRLGRPKTSAKVERAIRTRLEAGTGILRTAKALGVGTSVVQRIKATLA
jgi:hypothetical protein